MTVVIKDLNRPSHSTSAGPCSFAQATMAGMIWLLTMFTKLLRRRQDRHAERVGERLQAQFHQIQRVAKQIGRFHLFDGQVHVQVDACSVRALLTPVAAQEQKFDELGTAATQRVAAQWRRVAVLLPAPQTRRESDRS